MSDEIDGGRVSSGARKIILVTDRKAGDWLAPLVAQWIRDQIAWIAIVGPDCRKIEDWIDGEIIGDGLDRKRFIVTTIHPDETLDEVTDFMLSMVDEYEGDVAIINA